MRKPAGSDADGRPTLQSQPPPAFGVSNGRRGLQSLRGLTYDDVTILPEKTDVRPDQVSLRSEVLRGLQADLPVFAAPMDTVWSPRMTSSLAEAGALAPLARDMPMHALVDTIRELKSYELDRTRFTSAVHVDGRVPVIASASPFDTDKIAALLANRDVDYVLLDSVQPYNSVVIDAVARFSKAHPHRIIVGNLATADAALEFCAYELAGIKVGLGPGSICTTREISGVGVPQLEAIEEVAEVAGRRGIPIIADGGIRTTGDIAKALAAGGSTVMMGRLFAGTDEAPGRIEDIDGRRYKFYAGSKYTSVEIDAKTEEPGLEEFMAALESIHHRVEGVSGYTAYVGPAKALLLQIKRSLCASLAFTGSSSIDEFRGKARLIQISPAAVIEGRAHGLAMVTHQNRFFKG